MSISLWLVAAAGALAAAFFVAVLLTPGNGDIAGPFAVAAGVSALLALAAATALRRRGRDRRGRERDVVADVRQGRVLEQVAPSRRRWTSVALASGFLLVVSVLLVVAGSLGALVLVAVFGVPFALSLVQLAPGASWLRVTTRGVMTRHMGHTRAHRWEDVDGFRVYEFHTLHTHQRLVGWTVSERVRAHRRRARWLRWPSGVDDGLPTEYETDPDELVVRLQRYRDSHLDVPHGPAA